ncbi:MAG: transglycosylase domain-containing protein [Beijerinckiaceae bacterium]|jgi:hypothetical protein|nr:transglycosylase domain-containing protein [Beijerinckiaceae bacterium]
MSLFITETIDELAVRLDWAAMRLTGVPLLRPVAGGRPNTPVWQVPRIRLPAMAWPRPGATRMALVATAGTVAAMAGGVLAIEHHFWPGLAQTAGRMQPVAVKGGQREMLGLMPRPDAPRLRSGDGASQPMVTVPLPGAVPTDLMKGLVELEGEGILGTNLARSAMGFVCSRLGAKRCGGGSTLAMQAVRAVTQARSMSYARKIGEMLRATAIHVHFIGDDDGRERFIADHLFFGYANGRPLFGVEAAARAAFGKPAADLTLAEQLLLAAAPKRILQFTCAPPSQQQLKVALARRNRALHALEEAFADDPRQAAAHADLMAMPLLVRPAGTACAAAHPVGLPTTAPSMLVRLDREMVQLGPLEAVEAPALAMERPFTTSITSARAELASGRQRRHWTRDPAGAEVAVLGFTGRDGTIQALYESSHDNLLDRARETGSISKLPALAFLAAKGRTGPFCNKAHPPYHNAGGDPGVTDCAARPITAATVWGESLSLAVLAALEEYPEAEVRAQLVAWGFGVPAKSDARYAVAFGLISASPARMAAFVEALANGVAGRRPLGRLPRLVARYRTGSGWQFPPREQIDLSASFSTPAGQALIREAAAAALKERGTLAALGQTSAAMVAKSGTLDDDSKMVRLKVAAGNEGGTSWFAMAAPVQGAMGDAGVSILPLARVVRGTANIQAQ